MTLQPREQTIAIHISPNISRSKGWLCSSTHGLYPRPSTPRLLAPISSALGFQNIARTNLWIKHITYTRLYLFKIKTYLFKIFKKLFRRAKLWLQNKWKGFPSQWGFFHQLQKKRKKNFMVKKLYIFNKKTLCIQ